MKMIQLKYAESILSESSIFQNGSKELFRNIDFIIYLIKTKNKIILVDAGCDSLPGFCMKNHVKPVEILKKNGVLPENVTDILITHSHHDHIECVKYFKNALIHLQEDEYENGKNYIGTDQKVNLFKDEFELTKNIRMIKVGGHTKGSCVVEIFLEGKQYVIVGDECYQRECLEKKIPSGEPYSLEKNKKFIEKYSNTKYVHLLCHEE